MSREDDKQGVTRREALGRIGKAAYIAPTLTVLNLVPGLVQAQPVSGCPPFPGQGDPPQCNPGTESAPASKHKKKPGRG